MIPDGGCWLCIKCGFSECENVNQQQLKGKNLNILTRKTNNTVDKDKTI